MGRKNANVRQRHAKGHNVPPARRRRRHEFTRDPISGAPIPERTKKLGTMRKRMAA